MPQINGVVTDDGTTQTTTYTGTATNKIQTFFFSNKQNGFILTNNDTAILTLKVSGRSYIINAEESVSISQECSSFNIIRSGVGNSEFSLTAYLFHSGVGSVPNVPKPSWIVEDNLTSTNKNSALSANQGRVLNEQLLDIAKQKTNYVNVKAFGADSTGATNSVSAFQAAVAYMNANNINVLYIPSGTYKVVAGTNTSIILNKNTTVIGDGETSIIKLDDTPTVTGKTYSGSALFYATGANRVEFRNLRLEGGLFDYLTAYGQTNANPFFFITNTKEVIFQNLTLYGCRTINMQVENCEHVKAVNNTVKYSIRDGFRLINCSNVIATGNYFFNVSDDSIAISTHDSFTPSSGAVISNNIFEFSQGVRALGGKILNISNNIFKRCHYIGICVTYNTDGATEGEGHTPLTNINISNNTFADFLKFTVANDGDRIIEVNGGNIKSDSNGKIPSVNIAPYAYNYLDGTTPNGVSAMHGLRVNGNVFVRTLPNVATVDAWGYGQLLDRSVAGYWINSAITDASFAKVCIYFVGSVYDCIVSENIISGTSSSYGIWFYGLGATYTGVNLSNVKVINNHFYDLTNVGLYITNTYKKSNMLIAGNTFDIDPFFRNTYHLADNTWDINGTNGTAIGGTDLKGVVMVNNTFANCYKLFSGTPSVSTNNIAYASGTGATATNKGIYDLTKATTVIAIDGDPTSPTFRQPI